MERVVSTAIKNVRPVRTWNLAKLGASVAIGPPQLHPLSVTGDVRINLMLPLPDTDSGPAGRPEIQKPLRLLRRYIQP